MRRKNTQNGFSLVELLVGVSVFIVIIVSVYNAYISIFNIVYTSRAKIDAVDLVNERLEIVRNLPYADVGIVGGIPVGKLLHIQSIVRDSYSFDVTTTVRNIDDPFDGTLGGSPNDLSPADFKVVEIQVDCDACKNFKPLIITTRVAPKNLETASTNGALFVKVFDANGTALPNADVHIENNIINPHIVIDDVTNSSGMLQVVDAPPGNNAYEITVSKSGYSTDKTYSATVSNPHPTKPHATVVLQQVTQLSFSIDELSTINVNSVNLLCTPVPNVDFNITGAKQIGTSPNVYKYNQNKVTNGSGLLTLADMEWDSYAITNIDPVYDLIGISPFSPVAVAPGSTQAIQLIVAPKNPSTLLVTVKDSATGLPLSGVQVSLGRNTSTSTAMTGQGYISQTDWSAGSGQATSTNAAMYLASDGNINGTGVVGEISLKKVLNSYVASGNLTSSTFDLGGGSNFGQLYWNPASQNPATGASSVRLQIATNNDGGTWNFAGPDGTGATYYSSVNQNINAVHNGSRYLRYKIFLSTASSTVTPTVGDISFTYTTACTPPGQVSFSGLTQASNYTLLLTKPGYADQMIPVNLNAAWKNVEATMLAN